MENMQINHNGQLIQVAPILQEMDCIFAVDIYTNEALWIDSKTGAIMEDDVTIVGID